jgi:hypothetical protein
VNFPVISEKNIKMRSLLFLLFIPCSLLAQVDLKKTEYVEPSYMGFHVRGSALPVVKGGRDPIFSYHAGLSAWYAGHVVEVGFVHESDGFSGIEASLAFRVWGIDIGAGIDMGYLVGTNFSFLSGGGRTKANSSTGLRVRWSKFFKERWLVFGEIPVSARFVDHSERGREIMAEYGFSVGIRCLFNVENKKGGQ